MIVLGKASQQADVSWEEREVNISSKWGYEKFVGQWPYKDRLII